MGTGITPSHLNDLAYDFFDNITVESITGGIPSLGYIWNTSSLAWEKATGSAGAGNVTVTNFPATQDVDIVAQSVGDIAVTLDGEPIILGRSLDASNTSVANLGNGGVFTGSWVDTLNFASIVIQIFTDQDSADDGFEVQMSTDGVNPTHIHKFTVDANANGSHYILSLTCQYYRVVYTNGTTPQTSFSLCSSLSRYDATHSHTHPIDYAINGNHEAQLVRAVLTAEKPNTDYANIQATAGANLKVSVEEANGAFDPVRTDLEGNGYVSVGTSQVLLTFTGTTNTIHLESKITNVGTIWGGKNGVTNSGGNALFSMQAGESIDMRYDDVDNPLYVISDTASQSLLRGALL